MALHIDAERQANGLVDDPFVLPDLDHNAVRISDWINRVHWAELPFHHLFNDGVHEFGNQCRRGIGTVENQAPNQELITVSKRWWIGGTGMTRLGINTVLCDKIRNSRHGRLPKPQHLTAKI